MKKELYFGDEPNRKKKVPSPVRSAINYPPEPTTMDYRQISYLVTDISPYVSETYSPSIGQHSGSHSLLNVNEHCFCIKSE